jgi:hypothetical protein
MTQPASVTFDGTDLVLWVPTLGDPDFPTHTELTAGTVVDLSCYLSDTGWAPALTEAAVTDNRLCSSTDFQRPGRKGYALPMMYVFNPDVPADDEARLALTEGSEGYIVERPAVPFDTAIAGGDLVDVYPVVLGAQQPAGRTANNPWLMQQQAYLRGEKRTLVAVLAS